MRFYWRRARRLPIFPPPPGRSVYYCLLPSLFGTFSFENARVCDSTQHNGSTCCPLSIKQCQSLQCIVSFHAVPKGRLNGAQPEKWSPSIAIHIASGKAPSLLFS
ncbi:Aminotransferase tasG [Trichinella spiralis]